MCVSRARARRRRNTEHAATLHTDVNNIAASRKINNLILIVVCVTPPSLRAPPGHASFGVEICPYSTDEASLQYISLPFIPTSHVTIAMHNLFAPPKKKQHMAE